MTVTETADILRENDGFLILTHKRPDGDTVGSASALCHALRRMGKTAYLFGNPEVTEKYLPFAEPFFAPKGYKAQFVIAVDTAAVNMLCRGAPERADMCIDHHPSNTGYAEKTLLRAERSACGEIILEVIKALCGGIDKEEADLLYIAVSTDTGCFVYSNTDANTHRAAAEILEAGADMQRLNKLLFRTASKARILLEGYMYSGMQSYFDDRVNIVTVTLDMLKKAGAKENDCDDIASLPGRVENNVVGVTIRELRPGHCKLSLRSTEAVDSSAICARFGGGGHKMASGCEMDGTPEKCAEIIRDAIAEVLF